MYKAQCRHSEARVILKAYDLRVVPTNALHTLVRSQPAARPQPRPLHHHPVATPRASAAVPSLPAPPPPPHPLPPSHPQVREVSIHAAMSHPGVLALYAAFEVRPGGGFIQ